MESMSLHVQQHRHWPFNKYGLICSYAWLACTVQESQGKAASAAAAARKAKEALREEQERHRGAQEACSGLQADVRNVTAALEDAVKTLEACFTCWYPLWGLRESWG